MQVILLSFPSRKRPGNEAEDIQTHQGDKNRQPTAGLPTVNPRRACAARVTVVGSVCVSVKSHLTYGASVRPENAVTYSAGNEGQKMCGVFSENAPLQS